MNGMIQAISIMFLLGGCGLTTNFAEKFPGPDDSTADLSHDADMRFDVDMVTVSDANNGGWDHPSATGRFVVDVENATEDALRNVIVPVRGIDRANPVAYLDGSEIGIDVDDDVVWVRLPDLPSDGTQFFIYVDGLPGARPSSDVWSDFVGVWHDMSLRDIVAGNDGSTVDVLVEDEGVFGASSEFNGSTSRGLVPANADFLFDTTLTIELWAKPRALPPGITCIVARASATIPADNEFCLGIRDGAMFNEAFVDDDVPMFGAPVNANEWVHLSVVYDGLSVTLYRNGSGAPTTLPGPAVLDSSVPITFGADSNDLGQTFVLHFDGWVDEVRISPAAKSGSWLTQSAAFGTGELVSTRFEGVR